MMFGGFSIWFVFFVLALFAIMFSMKKHTNTSSKLDETNEVLKDFEIQLATMQVQLSEERNKNKLLLDDKLKCEEYTKEYIQTIQTDKAHIAQLQTKLEEQNNSMEEKLKLLQNSEEKLKQEFQNLATQIFDTNSKKFAEQNSENLGLILNPMKQQLTEFKKKVEDVYDKESKDRGALSAELKILKELNQKISTDAINLTNALKGQSKQQGIWGEMVLEKVLESSGLREGHEYNREVSLKDDDDKRFRPDVIVNLPENRHIIIDAKTSLVAYNDYVSAVDEVEKTICIKRHITAIKEHIKGLSNKKYEDLKSINSLDFIFMFIPIEGALLLALEHDVNLYDEAFKQKIILVSPTTLLVALRAVENSWRYEKQAQSIADVAKRAEQLYTKFNNFIDDLSKVGDSLKKADENYQKAFDKLSKGTGNLVWQATQLKQVSNIKPKKELEEGIVQIAAIDND